MEEHFDIAILGGGPAGLSAGLYAARATRRTVLFEQKVMGGQIALTSRVENYPGFIEGINGFDLAQQMHAQAERYGLETRYESVGALSREGERYRLAADGADILADAVIVSAGADYNRLQVEGEERLTGRGVSYCATCDAAFFKNEVVAVVGGGDAALDEGLFVSRYARKVYLIHRRDAFRASRVLQERAFANSKFEFLWDTVVESIDGGDDVEGVRIRNLRTGASGSLAVAAIFIFIGQHPNNEVLGGLLALDAGGHLPVDAWMRTAAPGLFAAGDIRSNSSRQVISAAGDGATAAIAADHYLNEHFPQPGRE